MLLKDKLSSIARPKIIPISQGQAKSIYEFNDKLLKNYAIDKDIALKWHKLLMKYIKSDNPLFAIRGYNSFPKSQYNDLRRGFLTETPDFSYFYTDNYFAAYFLKMCLDGYVPTFDDFYKTMIERRFPSRFGQITSNERELMAIPQGKDPQINSAGFKIAHIIPVGKEYFIGNTVKGTKEILDCYFPKGKREDWKPCTDHSTTFYKRTITQLDCKINKEIAIAHFLRFVHPFNYFICPQKKLESNSKCIELAEYQPLLDYMHDKMLNNFGYSYIEFLNLAMVDKKYANTLFDTYKNEIEISYGENVKTQSKQNPIKNITQPDISCNNLTNPEISLIWEFLNNPYTSFRKLESQFLNIDSAVRGGGFIAKKIVNSYGFSIKEKGILFDFEINEISDIKIRQLIINFMKKYNYI